MTGCILYYGVEVPDVAWAQCLDGVFVVVQDYHPLCREGLLAQFFPRCRRYVYFNPARFPAAWLGRGHTPDLESTTSDAYGNLAIDVGTPTSIRYLAAEAERLLSFEGVDGLFVDDLDVWTATPARRARMRSALEAVETASAPRPVHWFANRGFALWPALDRLDAVLLEGLSPQAVLGFGEASCDWVEGLLDTHLKVLDRRQQSVSVFALDYRPVRDEMPGDPAGKHSDRAARLARRLEARVHEIIVARRRLDEWPQRPA
jgi:hypothetical protein